MNDPATASRPPRFPITRLWLVRCGETQDTSFLPDFTGHADPGLSPLGRRQAEAIGRELAALATPPVSAVYASPLAAAQTTAALVADALGLDGVTTNDALVTVMPEQLAPGRDGIAAFGLIQVRTWAMVEALKERHEPDVSLALVSHELPIRAMIARALEIPLEDVDRFQVDEGSISAIEFRGPRTILAVLNDACHLQ